jgi:hypothetical protein
MKVGFIETAAVGMACAFAVLMRGRPTAVVLLNRNRNTRAGSSPISGIALATIARFNEHIRC